MYTQCPECNMAFRVTANDLKQAAGKVRCGGCGSPFDALEFLSEEIPRQSTSKERARALPELKPDMPASGLPESVSPEASIALLKTLDELAGSDIKIEDTGIEWRVLDDQVIADLETADAADDPAETSGAADSDPQTNETRYDDDSPVNDDTGEDEAEDRDEDTPGDTMDADADSAVDVDFDDDGTGDWEEILEEVDEADAPEPVGERVDEEPSGSIDEDVTGAENDDGEATDHESRHDESDETGEADEHLPVVDEGDGEVESIIMEGETVRSALDDLAKDGQANDVDMAFWTPPAGSAAKSQAPAGRFRLAAAAIALLLLLGLQVTHYYRETVATIPALQGIIVPFYRNIGMPLSPDWDVTGWRFEATQGDADADNEKLTVYSRIGNTTDGPLPYPLINIALTDRFEEPVGSRLLEPEEFLPGNANPRKLVPAGATFDAVMTVVSPDDAAIGYKLNVCYRSGGAANGQLRCATGDFKE